MRNNFQPAVYMIANRKNGAIYTGVTSNLAKRIWDHKQGAVDGFTRRYGCKLLVWFELHSTMEAAILHEKQIKGGSRKRKVALIEGDNPDWFDRFVELNR